MSMNLANAFLAGKVFNKILQCVYPYSTVKV